jgi:hypothetical protein
MHSALAFASFTFPVATASCTLAPSRTGALRENLPVWRLQSHRLVAPLFSYLYELLFPTARPHPSVFSYTYNSLGGQPLCFDNRPHCTGVSGSTSGAASGFLCALGVSVANPFFSYDCSLFCALKKVNSFAIKQIQPLFRKHPGWGYLDLEAFREATYARRTHPIINNPRLLRCQVHG